MKRVFVAVAECSVLVLALVLIQPFSPFFETGEVVHSQAPPPAPILSQWDASWDSNLTLPDTSDRIVHYVMDARLDTAANIIRGSEILEWRNTTGQPQTTFPFHLYHNAFRNNRSTFARESEWALRNDMSPEDYGWTDIRSIGVYDGDTLVDILPTLQYVQPDDGNPDDRTVFEVTIPLRLTDLPAVRFAISFETKQPKPVSRTGVIREYHFVAQWFPKIGVWWNPDSTGGAWNCHQFHSNSEFFADFGRYDVKITVPKRYVVGATGGIPRSTTENDDGTITHRFVQDDVHDFAWVTAPDLQVHIRTFAHTVPDPGERSDRHHPLKEVRVILLSQPHHEGMVDRYFTATKNALRWFGEWYGEYPYETVTVVDPANGSNSGGMEYPTLFTGGTDMFSPPENASPEGVTVHEFGHQFWYGLVGNNEFEEAWLDEGFNTYSTDRVMRTAWPPFKPVQFFFGGSGAGTSVGIPYVFHEVKTYGLESDNTALRHMGKDDVMARKAWEYHRSYGLNSYTKPGLSLVMLERLLGEEMMYRVMRTYHHRYRFRHPTSADFIRTVNEVTGKDYQWFFDQTWYSSNVIDYAVESIVNRSLPAPEGNFGPKQDSSFSEVKWKSESEVILKREGEAIMPVDVQVAFADHWIHREQWDGRDRWKRFRFHDRAPVVSAEVDPDGKLVMDINRNNNSKAVATAGSWSLAAHSYASRFMFWMQNYLELTSYWH